MTETRGSPVKTGNGLSAIAAPLETSGNSSEQDLVFRGAAGPRGLFITGTDTGVGKTHVTCLIARHLIACGVRVAAYKPVCSGAISSSQSLSPSAPHSANRWDDIERLMAATGGEWSEDIVCPQRFLAPLAAPVAARLEGRLVDSRLLVEGARRFLGAEVLLIEGAGGWLSPLTQTSTVADLARELNARVLIVARAGLGTINHTLLTIESVRARGLIVAGIVLNEVVSVGDDASCRTNGDEIETRGGVTVFGTVPHGSGDDLHRDGQPVTIDWHRLAEPLAESS